jgi:hypothetical protein
VDDAGFQDRVRRDAEARRIAQRILRVEEGAKPDELRRAWRKACKEQHPDRNPGDNDAGRKFAAVNCAYRLLAYGEPCDVLVEEHSSQYPNSGEDNYRLDSAWGVFLWWRDRFFCDTQDHLSGAGTDGSKH